MLGLGIGLASPAIIGGSRGFNPVVGLGSKLVGWLNSDDHGTARMVDDGSGVISSWTDRVSTAAFTITGANRPTWGAATFNSAYSSVNCTTDDYLAVAPIPGTGATPAVGGAWPSGASNVEIWAVVNQKSLPADTTARTFFGYGNAAATTIQLRRIVSGGINRLQLTTASNLSDATTVFSGPHVVAGVVYGTTTSEIWIDGALRASGVTTTLATATTKSVIGANIATTPSIFAEVGIRHIFVISGTLTSTTGGEKDKLFGWCAWDSGLQSLLPANNPYKNAPP